MFDDLETPINQIQTRKAPPQPQFKCTHCNGTGKWSRGTNRYGNSKCNPCRGKGYFFTSANDRRKAKQLRASRADQKMAENIRSFAAEHKEFYLYIVERSSRWNFANSLVEQIQKGYDLSEKQFAVIYRAMEADDKKAADKIEAESKAPMLNLLPVKEALDAAHSKGVRNPKMAVDGACFIRAKDNSKNPHHIYVKASADWEATYLGKVTPEGKFIKSWDCTEEMEQRIVELGSDVIAAARAYGQKFGCCSFCRRELTNNISIALSYGPICAEHYGLPHDKEYALKINPEAFED